MKKIPVNPSQEPLQNPFGALDPGAFPAAAEASAPAPERAKPRGPRPRVVLRREKADRGGKTVIVAGALPTHLGPSDLENLLRQAKKSLGCG
ncbi:MAG: hypothetical protein N2322_06125, partial [Terrimicrobiaceae bacterium]|nr:hypothetical protein [Terrimicrobiaceae bacterium]